jgi:hypothetical protein
MLASLPNGERRSAPGSRAARCESSSGLRPVLGVGGGVSGDFEWSKNAGHLLNDDMDQSLTGGEAR